jgi:hypothetical protein
MTSSLVFRLFYERRTNGGEDFLVGPRNGRRCPAYDGLLHFCPLWIELKRGGRAERSHSRRCHIHSDLSRSAPGLESAGLPGARDGDRTAQD